MSNVSPQYYEGFRAAVGGSVPVAAPPPVAVPTARVENAPMAEPPIAAVAISEEERIKRELPPLDAFSRLLECAKNNRAPGADDQFRFRWFGLIYQGPRQDAFVLRLRLPGGRLQAYQLTGLVALTQELAGGCVLCNEQGGLDIPGVAVRDAVEVMRRAEEIGLRSLLSGGDCVWAVRGGEYENLTERSRPPVIYPLVRELEQALAMDRRLADLPTGCEVILRGFGEAVVKSDSDAGKVIFQAVPESDGSEFLLTVPDFGLLDRTLTAAQVIPACLELLGRWAEQGDRSDRHHAGIAEFCAGVGADRLCEWLALRTGPLAAVATDAGGGAVAASPMPVGVPVPVGGLLSVALERLAEVARCHGSYEIRLAGARLFIPGTSDQPAANDDLRRALTLA